MIDTAITFFGIFGFILFPLGQLGRISFSNQQISFYPYEVVMVISLILLVLRYRFRIRHAPVFRSVVYLLCWLSVSFLFSLRAYSAYDNLVGALYLVRFATYLVYFVYLSVHIAESSKYRATVSCLLYFLVVVIALSSTLQYLFYPNLRNLLYEGWDPHLYRVFGLFFEPYLAGAALGLGMIYIFFNWKAKARGTIMKWAVLLFLFVLLMLTFSRTVYLAILVTAAVYFLGSKRPYLIAGVIALFVVLAIIIPKPVGVGVQLFRTFSVETRLNDAGEGIALWLKQPVFGVGYNRIRYKKAELGLALEFGSSHAAANYHSSFVTMLASSGVVGLVLFLYFLYLLAGATPASFFVVLFLSVISLGDNALLHPFMLFMFLHLAAVEKRHSSLV